MGGENAHIGFLVLVGCFLGEKVDLVGGGEWVRSHKRNPRFWRSSCSHHRNYGGSSKIKNTAIV